ncbi:MAG: HTTM domain-containing protein [Bacteroidota bacterium]
MSRYAKAMVPIAPLAVFRALFGIMMMGSIIRFAAKGWIAELYINPQFHFTYYGFDWVRPLGDPGMYLLFGAMFLGAAGIALGFLYRWSAGLFFLSFTYVELIDKTNYLNHYYFVSLMAFLLILLPAHRAFSLDAWRKPELRTSHVPRWTVGAVRWQLGLVYVFAGIAKLNPSWLIEAQPLRIWLPANAHLPVIGPLLAEQWVAYAFSWFGAVYDLTIPFLLLTHRFRPFAYAAVVVFHVMTAILFPIGMFPYIMIISTLVFFPASFHQRLLNQWRHWFGSRWAETVPHTGHAFARRWRATALPGLLVLFFAVQAVIPMRYVFYPGKLFWTVQGYRFSWRVMLMEKAGYAIFTVQDPATGRKQEIRNYDYLTPNQEKMMATQPDMLLQFAHFLREESLVWGFREPEVRVQCYVTLNGHRSQLFVDPSVDLARERRGFHHKPWILPFQPQRPHAS